MFSKSYLCKCMYLCTYVYIFKKILWDKNIVCRCTTNIFFTFYIFFSMYACIFCKFGIVLYEFFYFYSINIQYYIILSNSNLRTYLYSIFPIIQKKTIFIILILTKVKFLFILYRNGNKELLQILS